MRIIEISNGVLIHLRHQKRQDKGERVDLALRLTKSVLLNTLRA